MPDNLKPLLFYLLFIPALLFTGCFKQIQRYEKTRIASINFEGNHFTSDDKLRSLLPVKRGDEYNQRAAKKGADRIIEFYRSKGFFNMRVTRSEGKFIRERNVVEITYHIFEGVRSRIGNIQINGNTIFTDRNIRSILNVKEKQFYDESRIVAGEYSISNSYAEEGYPNASIKVEKSRESNKNGTPLINLSVIIEEKEKVWVKGIEFRGLKEVGIPIVKREMRIRKGEMYRPSEVYKSQSNLYKTEMFSDIKVEEKTVSPDSVILTFNFKEEKSHFMQLGFGYESPKKGIINLRWGDLNVFGNLQSLIIDLSVKATPDFNAWNNIDFEDWEQNIRVTYREPYFLNTGFRLVLSPSYTYTETERDFSVDLALERDLSINSVISLIYDFKLSSMETDTSITNKIALRHLYDGRNNILNPTDGIRVISRVEYAGGYLRGDNHFNRFHLDIAKYTKIPFGIVAATRFMGVLTQPREPADLISPDARLDMGGYGSLRGFDEYSIGTMDERGKRSGLNELLFNVEFRIPVYGKLYATIFADFGNLWMNFSDISLTDFHMGSGFGLGYQSPIGVIRIDYARAIEKVSPGYLGKIYFNFGQPF